MTYGGLGTPLMASSTRRLALPANKQLRRPLKACAMSLNLPLKRTHSLPVLLSDVGGSDERARDFRDSVIVLDAYYAPTRYADALVELEYGPEQASDALTRATDMLLWLQPQIEARLDQPDDDPQAT